MKYKGRRQSNNVEDRRGMSAGKVGAGLGGIGLVLVIVFTLLSGGNIGDVLTTIMGSQSTPVTTSNEPYVSSTEEDELVDFVSVVLADTEDIWTAIFKEQGLTYREPTLVLFTESVQSACGVAGSSVGPFYCPADQKLYIDLSFYKELKTRFKAPGDFAMAYVVAHEVGHHVQTLLGTSQQVHALNGKVSDAEYNAATVKLELQADYFAGVFAHYQKQAGYLDIGDIDEALTAANAIGDDTLQMQARGYVVPESFTHGTSEQRKRWFKKGYDKGTIEGGDTFNAKEL